MPSQRVAFIQVPPSSSHSSKAKKKGGKFSSMVGCWILMYQKWNKEPLLHIFVHYVIVSPSTIDKMFEIYTFFKNTTEIRNFFENRTENLAFFSKIGSKFISAFCSKIGPKISKNLTMADEVTIRVK